MGLKTAGMLLLHRTSHCCLQKKYVLAMKMKFWPEEFVAVADQMSAVCGLWCGAKWQEGFAAGFQEHWEICQMAGEESPAPGA